MKKSHVRGIGAGSIDERTVAGDIKAAQPTRLIGHIGRRKNDIVSAWGLEPSRVGRVSVVIVAESGEVRVKPGLIEQIILEGPGPADFLIQEIGGTWTFKDNLFDQA